MLAFRGLLICCVPASIGGGCRDGVNGSECWLLDSDENGVGASAWECIGSCGCGDTVATFGMDWACNGSGRVAY